MAGAIAIDDKFIDDLTEDTVNFLAARVQNALGVTTGDVAGVHFSDFSEEGPKSQIAKIIRDYLAIEEMYSDDDRASTFQDAVPASVRGLS